MVSIHTFDIYGIERFQDDFPNILPQVTLPAFKHSDLCLPY